MIPPRWQWPLGILVVALAAAAPLVFSDFTTGRVLTRALWLGVAAASLIFLAAYGGWVSLGQVGLYGIAGFAYGNLVEADGGVKTAIGVYPALLLAIAITVVIGLGIGAISSRSEGIYFLMITLAFGVIIKQVFEKATNLSGFGGINQVPRPSFIGNPSSQPERLYYVALAVSVLVYLGIRYLARTPFGLAFQGIRDNAGRMRALGYHVTLHRTLAFGVGALIASLAGIMNVWWDGAIAPGVIDTGPVIYLLMIAIIGGLYHIEGAWIGALVFAVLDNRLRSVELVGERVTTAIGVIFLVIVLISPNGIVGIAESISRRLARRGGGPPAPAPAEGAPASAGAGAG